MKGIKHDCELMERYDGHDHGEGVRECGEVRQLSGGNFMYKRQTKIELLDVRDIRTRQHDAPLFMVPFPNKELYKRSIQYAAAGSVLWNNLPATTRATDNYLVFKTLQKRKMCESFK